MFYRCSRPASLLPALCSTVLMVSLCGCGSGSNVGTATDLTAPSTSRMTGILHGGPNAVVGATVTLYVSKSAGYGGAATVVTSTTTLSDGSFALSLPGTFSCPAGQFAYVTSYAGNTGSNSTNAASLLMVPVGACATNYSGASYTGQSLWIDELTTAVSAYALGNFITIDTSGTAPVVNMSAPAANNSPTPCIAGVGTCTATAAAGLQHAMANALSIINIHTGKPYSANANGGAIAAPQIYSMGNFLQACVNSSGPTGTNTAISNDGTGCGKLFSFTTPPIGSPVPTNTLQAMINLAKYPNPYVQTWDSTCTTAATLTNTTTGTTCLYNLGTPQGAYAGALTTAPPDWGLTVVYPKLYGANTTTCTGTCPGLTYPWMVATDISDDVYVANNDSSSPTYQSLLGFQFDGTVLFASTADTTLKLDKFVSTDGLGHVLIANNSSTANQIKVYSGSTGTVQTLITTAITSPLGIFADPFNNIWYSSSTGGITNIGQEKYLGNDTSGNPTYSEVTFSPAPQATQGMTQLALDSQLNVWAIGSNSTASTAYLLPNTGTLAAPTYTAGLVSAATTGSTTNGYGLFPDSNNNAWLVTGAGFFKITKTGTGASATLAASSNLYTGVTYPRYTAVDGLNTVFAADYNNGSGASGIGYYDGTNGLVLGKVKGCRALTGTTCGTSSTTEASGGSRGLAIDSSGDVWVVGASSGTLVEFIGLAAPSWPALSLCKAGRPQ